MLKSRSADEIAAHMAETLDIHVNKNISSAVDFAVQHIIKIADALDAAGFSEVAEVLDNTLKQMASLTKSASVYEGFLEQIAGVKPGDCQAVRGIYNRFAAQLEGEGSFLRARQDCLMKCPSFRPE